MNNEHIIINKNVALEQTDNYFDAKENKLSIKNQRERNSINGYNGNVLFRSVSVIK